MHATQDAPVYSLTRSRHLVAAFFMSAPALNVTLNGTAPNFNVPPTDSIPVGAAALNTFHLMGFLLITMIMSLGPGMEITRLIRKIVNNEVAKLDWLTIWEQTGPGYKFVFFQIPFKLIYILNGVVIWCIFMVFSTDWSTSYGWLINETAYSTIIIIALLIALARHTVHSIVERSIYTSTTKEWNFALYNAAALLMDGYVMSVLASSWARANVVTLPYTSVIQLIGAGTILAAIMVLFDIILLFSVSFKSCREKAKK